MQINEAAKDSEISLKPGRYIRIGCDSRLPNPRDEYELLKKLMKPHIKTEYLLSTITDRFLRCRLESLNKDDSFDRRQYLNPELKDMFFALSLIESYGSGIRRAKEALKRNGSPSLIFYPDNEKDDYTNAVIFINP